jgi:hypothetical protein
MAYNTSKTGTGFTNLSKIYQANQGNQLGQAVSSNIQQAGDQANQQVQQAKSQFQTEAEKNRLDTDANKQFAKQTIGGVMQDDKASASDEQKNKFKDILGGQYKGPQDLGDKYQSLYQQSQQAQDLGNLATSSGGRQELLRRTVGGSGYGQGMRKIDSALLNQNGQDLSQARRATQGLVQNTEQAQQQAQLTGQQLQGQAKQFAEDTKGEINQNFTGLDTNVQEQFKAAQKEEADRLTKVQALQRFASNQTPVLNADGTPKLDMNGNPVMTATRGNFGGTTPGDIYSGSNQGMQQLSPILAKNANILADTEKFKGLMKQLGILNQDQEKDVFGTGSMRDVSRKTGIDLVNLKNGGYEDYIKRLYGDSTKNLFGKLGEATGSLTTQRIGNYYEPMQNEIQGKLENLYKNIATQAGNAQSAQNLSNTGVASDAIRNKYTALQQLMGLSGTDIKYDPNAAKYQKGNLNIDTSKI